MGRRANGTLGGKSGGKSNGNSALFISPRSGLKRPALRGLLEKPVMKEIKPVAAKKNATRLKKSGSSKSTKAGANKNSQRSGNKSSSNGIGKGAPSKSSVVPSRPTKATPSKKIASSV